MIVFLLSERASYVTGAAWSRRRRHRPDHHLIVEATLAPCPNSPGALPTPSLRGRARLEELALSPLAVRSYDTRGRARSEEECGVRTPFQRDRDRILHSKPFRRLKGKTQVFIDPAGDHYRTRMTHTLETTGIARVVARALGLNEDLAEAIGLGHDMGHPPFGHAGESALDELAAGAVSATTSSRRASRERLNLTHEVVDGILTHTGDARARDARGEDRAHRRPRRLHQPRHRRRDPLRDPRRGRPAARRDRRCSAPRARSGSTRSSTTSSRCSARAGDIVQSEEVGAAMLSLRAFMFDRVYLGAVDAAGARARARGDRPHLRASRGARRRRG